MGILNLSPDSFAGTSASSVADAVDVALRMEADGADIIDIGGESTRPGAAPLSEADERHRVLPVIDRIVARVRVPVSVDTYKAAIARDAIQAGAALINDISGLAYEPALGEMVARGGAGLVLMHTRGRPASMYAQAHYDDVCRDVARELAAGVERAEAAGIARDAIIVDPGIGFAKRAAHSYGVLAGVAAIGGALERPVLVGPSRKSFMADALDQRPASERDWGTAAAVTAAVLHGAHIIRVHAVREMVQVIRVAEEIRRHRDTQ